MWCTVSKEFGCSFHEHIPVVLVQLVLGSCSNVGLLLQDTCFQAATFIQLVLHKCFHGFVWFVARSHGLASCKHVCTDKLNLLWSLLASLHNVLQVWPMARYSCRISCLLLHTFVAILAHDLVLVALLKVT